MNDTEEAVKEIDGGGMKSFESYDELMEDLNEGGNNGIVV
jgi:hypothetical protein